MNNSNSPQGNSVKQSQPGSDSVKGNLLSMLPEASNVTGWERIASIGGGALLFARGMRKGGIFGLVNLAMGAAAMYRGVTGHCEMKERLSKKMG